MALARQLLARVLRGALRNVRFAALFLLAGSEALILEWGLRAFGTSLGLGGALAAAVGLCVANLAALALLPLFARGTAPGFALGRVWLVGSLAALTSGPPLALAFALFVPLAFLPGVLGERAAGVGEALFLAGGGGAVALGFGAMFWGWAVGQRRVAVERLDLPLPGLPDALAGLRIAHITDLHIGLQLRAPRLRELIARVNALEPDLVAITGDIFDFDPAFIEEGARELAELRAPLGVFAVLGNHDTYTGANAVAAGLAAHTKIRLLRDEWVSVAQSGSALVIAGVEDPGRGWNERDATHDQMERLAESIPRNLPCVLLVHRPSYFAQAARLGFPLSLAGHTHGGQIALPPPAHHHNISRLISRWTRGLFRDDASGALLYVNRGLGVAGPPVRLNCPREIALLRLVGAKRNGATREIPLPA